MSNKILNPAKYGKGLKGMFRQGWNEIPEVLGSTFMALIGISLGATAVYTYYAKDGDNRKYKMQYTVLRHDDPNVARIKKD